MCVLFMAIVAQAQDVKKLRMGFTLNPGISWMSAGKKPVEKAGSNAMIGLGVVADYFFADNYGFSTGLGISFGNGGSLYYNPSTTKYYNPRQLYVNSDLSDELKNAIPDSIGTAVTTKYNMRHIEVPFGFRFKSNEMNKFTFYIEPGFLLGVKIGGNGDVTFNSKTYKKENIASDMGWVNFAWGVGAGAYYNVSENTSLVAGFHFNNGFTDMTRNNKGSLADDTKSVLNRLSLKIGVMF